MTENPVSLGDEEQNQKHPFRVSGGFVFGLLLVGFFLVMLLTLPDAWPLFALLLGIGAAIAFWKETRESYGYPDAAKTSSTEMEAGGQAKIFGPNAAILMPWITSHPVGLVLAIGVSLVVFIGLPESRLFIVGSVALGGLFGAVLWWKHR
jgi:hypothetical protein